MATAKKEQTRVLLPGEPMVSRQTPWSKLCLNPAALSTSSSLPAATTLVSHPCKRSTRVREEMACVYSVLFVGCPESCDSTRPPSLVESMSSPL